MKRKMTIVIAGRTYILTADEDDTYISSLAEYVNQQIDATANGGGDRHVSAVDAATMAAMNIADSYYKEHAAAENLRGQLKAALDDTAKVKNELSESKREIFRLQQGKS